MEDDEKFASNDSPSGSSTTYRVVRTPSPLNATSPLTPTATTPTPPLIQTITNSLQRKKGRLQRSERLQTQESATSSTNSNNSSATSTTTFSAWEALVKESFGQIAWPIKITSWELVDDKVKIVPNSVLFVDEHNSLLADLCTVNAIIMRLVSPLNDLLISTGAQLDRNFED
ncbi:hypothetical protein GQX74_007983 [Glossina fuscipes]|nr:hypothetical protein GQX74_007983 [Glossina fuscipes]